MAEYYPLISRAVAGLRTGTPESRRAIYDRARQALVGQLRAMDPPVPEEAIAKETAALDEAIERTEADLKSPGGLPAAPEPKRPLNSAPKSRPAPRTVESTSSPIPKGPPPPPKRIFPPAAESPRASDARPPAPRTSGARQATSPADASRQTLERPAAPVDNPALPWSAGESRAEPSAATLPAATTLKVELLDSPWVDDGPDSPQISVTDEDRSGRSETSVLGRDGTEERSRDEASRPAAPRPVEPRRSNRRGWIVAVAALAAVVAIAFTAWRLRDNPQALTRTPVAKQSQPSPGKIVDRADNSSMSDSSNQPVNVATDQASQTAKEVASSPAPVGSTPPPENAASTLPATDLPSSTVAATTAVPAPAVPAPAVPAPAVPTATPSASNLPIPVAYKAAILVDAPDLPEKVKTYVGTVVWHVQNVPQGQGQPIGTAIEAEITVPDAKTQLVMQLRRNTEAQLPASHTIDLKYTVASDSPLGAIKQINVPQMRQRDSPTGDPLTGIPVTIADNYFLIGLVRGAEDKNVELLRLRGWFDIPMLLANGKASKITFEKGASGDRMFSEVLDGWKNAQN